jgi:hypothetical protein
MSAIQKINQLSHRIFNTSLTEQTVARSSNPFATSNFQKNILTEDVFESSKAKEKSNLSFTGNLNASSKRIYSTFVGSISNFGSRLIEGIESIKAFGCRMKDSVLNTWNKINELGRKEVTLDGAKDILSRDITSFFVNSREREISKMSKMNPHLEVKPMLQSALSALESDMVKVA